MPIEDRRVRNHTVIERCKRKSNRVSACPRDVIESGNSKFENIVDIRKVGCNGRRRSNDKRHEGRDGGIIVIREKILGLLVEILVLIPLLLSS